MPRNLCQMSKNKKKYFFYGDTSFLFSRNDNFFIESTWFKTLCDYDCNNNKKIFALKSIVKVYLGIHTVKFLYRKLFLYFMVSGCYWKTKFSIIILRYTQFLGKIFFCVYFTEIEFYYQLCMGEMWTCWIDHIHKQNFNQIIFYFFKNFWWKSWKIRSF